MTSLTDRPNTALLVIDMQRGVVAGGHEVEQVVDRIATLIDCARGYDARLVGGTVSAADADLTDAQ